MVVEPMYLRRELDPGINESCTQVVESGRGPQVSRHKLIRKILICNNECVTELLQKRAEVLSWPNIDVKILLYSDIFSILE